MPCGKNTEVTPVRDRRLGCALDDAVLDQDAGDRAVRLEMDFAVVHAGAHQAGEFLLGGVERRDQGLEVAVGRRRRCA